MTEAEVVEKLHQFWNVLNDNLSDEMREKWWRLIVDKCSDNRRKFHNLNNIGRMLIHLENCEKQIKSAKALSYAIFFQYLEYDPKSSDNQEKCEQIFAEFANDAQIDKEEPLFKEVVELILSTNSNLTEEHLSSEAFGSTDKHYFLDIDLCYMGANKDEYNKYCAAIRDEFSFMDDKSYFSLRLKLLKSLVQIPKIFATKMFHEKYESQARSNIAEEISTIEANINNYGSSKSK